MTQKLTDGFNNLNHKRCFRSVKVPIHNMTWINNFIILYKIIWLIATLLKSGFKSSLICFIKLCTSFLSKEILISWKLSYLIHISYMIAKVYIIKPSP
ncbi:hypothetical protein C1645_49339 [Glomus cerebriforme]|uniref:Uncharacterized protein n=1 Tax=Glomus cerebriforme TaxID=658196 RepID=A0A397SAC8_9GLOM|nr:hypothetical protein C1645_49339 [Glomus cerebriforme]